MTTEGETPAADPADELVPLASVDRMLDDAELLLANIVYDRHTPLSDNHSLAVQVAKALAWALEQPPRETNEKVRT